MNESRHTQQRKMLVLWIGCLDRLPLEQQLKCMCVLYFVHTNYVAHMHMVVFGTLCFGLALLHFARTVSTQILQPTPRA